MNQKKIRDRFIHQISITIALSAAFSAYGFVGELTSREKHLVGRSDVIFFTSFDNDLGTNQWKADWGIPWEQNCDRAQYVTGSDALSGRSLRFTFEAGKYGAIPNGMQWPVDFSRIPSMPEKSFESLYFRYYLKFEEGFDFRRGGKLPGLISVNEGWDRSGGNFPDGTNGWTMRYMWMENGRIVAYAYLPKGTKYGAPGYGNPIDLNYGGFERRFQAGKWHCLEQYIKLNTPGREDGKLHIWLDGEPALILDDVTYRTVANGNNRIGGMYFSTFHGGSDQSWAPQVNSHVVFDNFVVAKKPIGALDGRRVLAVKPDMPAPAVNGQSYGHTVGLEPGQSASGCRWSVTSGTLPAGLTLSPEGEISGTTRDRIGCHTFTVSVEDAQGAKGRRTIMLDVLDPGGENLANATTLKRSSNNFSGASPLEGLWDGKIFYEHGAFAGNYGIDSFWVEYDLGELHTLSLIRLFGDTEKDWVSENFTVQVKQNEDDDYRALTSRANCFGNKWFEQSVNVTTRFIRLSVVGDPESGHTEAREFEVYGIQATDGATSLESAQIKKSGPSIVFAPETGLLSLTFEGELSGALKASLYDIKGREIPLAVVENSAMSGKIAASFQKPAVASGFYTLIIMDGAKIIGKQRIRMADGAMHGMENPPK